MPRTESLAEVPTFDLNEFFEFDDMPTRAYTRLDHSNKLWGPCPDDHECTAPYIGMLPTESRTVNGSPLKFRSGK